jgi:LysM repeat protein
MKPPMHDVITLRQPALIKTVHTVISGDTMNGIAIKYGTTSQAIMTENGLTSTSIYIGQKLTIPGTEKIVKDDQGFPQMQDITILARVTDESSMVIDDKGQERQATKTVCLDGSLSPNLGDQIIDGLDIVTIIKVKARRSYSGKKTYYWVAQCGE